MTIEGETEDPGTMLGMTAVEFERAVASDEAIREAITKNKEAAERQGQVQIVTMSQEHSEKIARANILRIELGGYSTLSPEIRANENVQKTVTPKLREYIRLRLQLASEQILASLAVELGMTKEDVASKAFDDLKDALASAKPLAGLPTHPLNGKVSAHARIDELEARVLQLEKRVSDLP
jgi:MoaA/NifB/PqqE/SkfB family radical SAM enzyme